MDRPTCLIELCAGTGALSLAVVGGPYCRPPVSRMGAKTGYVKALSAVLGIRLGRGADSVILVEPDPGMASVLRCYSDPEALRAVAERIRGWADRDPRGLWNELRAEGKAERGEDVAGYLYLWEGSYAAKGPDAGCAEDVLNGIPKRHNFGGFRPARERCLDKVNALSLLTWPPVRVIQGGAEGVTDYLLNVSPETPLLDMVDGYGLDAVLRGKLFCGRGGGADCPDGCFGQLCVSVALSDLGRPVSDFVCDVLTLGAPTQVVSGVVVPRTVKVPDDCPVRAWAVKRLADHGGHAAIDAPPSGAEDDLSISVLVETPSKGAVRVAGRHLSTIGDAVLRRRFVGSPFSHDVPPCTRPTIPYGGVIVYMDVPYQGTTGYAHDFDRAPVLEVAQRWHRAGATVCISECVSLRREMEEATGDRWFDVEITGERVGQRRTFGGTEEWLTLNRPPAWRPSEQVGLFR